MIVFKLLFAYLGYLIWGFQGAIVGVILGHGFDHGVSVKIRRWRYGRHKKRVDQSEKNKVFFISIFSMFAKLTQVDGELTKPEHEFVQKFMKDAFSLNRKQRKYASSVFAEALGSNTSFQLFAAQFYEHFKDQPTMLENTIEMMLQLAASDGVVNSDEEKVIREAAVLFKMNRSQYEAMLSRYYRVASGARQQQSYQQQSHQQQGNGRSYQQANSGNGRAESTGSHQEDRAEERVSSWGDDLDGCYNMLGCKRSDPDDVVKKAYRKLVAEYHPDKIASKELPQGFTDFANQKFKDIQSAWEAVKDRRGIA